MEYKAGPDIARGEPAFFRNRLPMNRELQICIIHGCYVQGGVQSCLEFRRGADGVGAGVLSALTRLITLPQNCISTMHL